MGRWAGKYVIGLTGNIATGKSVVRRMLEHLGAYTLDADVLAHRVMAPNAPAYQPIVDLFGKFVVKKEDGQIDRERLGAIAFAHPEALKELEALTHPHVRAGIDTLISRSTHKIIVVEAIKLLEGDLASMVDAIWVVDATPEEQLKRLMTKRGMSELEARKRISAQNPQSEKLARAHVIIQNNGSQEETWAQVQAAWNKIEGSSEDTKAVEAVQTVAVEVPVTSPAPTPTPPHPAPVVAAKPTPGPAPTAPTVTLTSLSVKRPRPADFERIAAFMSQVSGKPVTRADIMTKFGEKTYLLAEAEGKELGIIGFAVDNLVTRVDEFLVLPQSPIDSVAKGLIQAMENASSDLQSEIAFVFLPESQASYRALFMKQGYQEVQQADLRSNTVWREAVKEYQAKTQSQTVISRKLREKLVLKPI